MKVILSKKAKAVLANQTTRNQLAKSMLESSLASVGAKAVTPQVPEKQQATADVGVPKQGSQRS